MSAFESPESSSPIVTRAVAAGLRGEYAENYPLPGWQKAALLALGALPQAAARFALSRFQALSGLPPRLMDDFRIETLIGQRLADYAGLAGPFPAVTVGAALGGATTYLSLAVGGPFLPQAFVVSLRGGAPTGDVRQYLRRSLDLARRLTAADPRLFTIQHYDPVHDGWLTRYVNHLRFKLLDLPSAYAAFLRERLAPGGAVVFLEGKAQWLRYRLGERSVFQVGGWGGLPPEEFLQGSERLNRYARRAGLKFSRWALEEFPLEQGPESEWGSEAGLGEALEAFCRAEGFRFVRIALPHPNDFSRLAFAAAARLLEKEGRQPAGTLIEMFSQFDASAAIQTGLLPLWLVFNTRDSLEYLTSMRPRFPAGKPVFFSPLATFSLTPDLVAWEDWQAALDGLEWVNIGARRSHYPADGRAIVRWAAPLRAWAARHRQPLSARLTAEELQGLALAGGR
ncbi:MAG: hypothetical protein ABWK53_11200 [Anaerolineales bacterium]